MVNLCIGSMQVHQSLFSLFFFFFLFFLFFITFFHSGLILFLHQEMCPCVTREQGTLPLLDPVLRFVVVHSLLPLSQEGIHTLVCPQELVHADDGFKGQNAGGGKEKG